MSDARSAKYFLRFTPPFRAHDPTLPLALLALLVAACDNASDTEDDLPLGTVTARVDGQAYHTGFGTAALAPAGDGTGRFMFTLSSGSATGSGLGLTIFPFNDEGEYGLEGATPAGFLRFGVFTRDGQTWSSDRNGGSGSLTITRVTPTAVEGTFEFVAPNTRTGPAVAVTEGRFNVGLQRL
jgi:hypothetical protein